MNAVFWICLIAAAVGLAYWYRHWRRRHDALKRASEERFATFMAQAMTAAGAKPPQDTEALAPQRLLLEAAAKAGEAGEPALSIQLYARLLSRYPQSTFAAQARAAVEVQKKKLAKA